MNKKTILERLDSINLEKIKEGDKLSKLEKLNKLKDARFYIKNFSIVEELKDPINEDINSLIKYYNIKRGMVLRILEDLARLNNDKTTKDLKDSGFYSDIQKFDSNFYEKNKIIFYTINFNDLEIIYNIYKLLSEYPDSNYYLIELYFREIVYSIITYLVSNNLRTINSHAISISDSIYLKKDILVFRNHPNSIKVVDCLIGHLFKYVINNSELIKKLFITKEEKELLVIYRDSLSDYFNPSLIDASICINSSYSMSSLTMSGKLAEFLNILNLIINNYHE